MNAAQLVYPILYTCLRGREINSTRKWREDWSIRFLYAIGISKEQNAISIFSSPLAQCLLQGRRILHVGARVSRPISEFPHFNAGSSRCSASPSWENLDYESAKPFCSCCCCEQSTHLCPRPAETESSFMRKEFAQAEHESINKRK